MYRTNIPNVGYVLYFIISIVLNLIIFKLRISAQEVEIENVSNSVYRDPVYGKMKNSE